VQLETGVHGDAEPEEGEDRPHQDEALAPAAQEQVAEARPDQARRPAATVRDESRAAEAALVSDTFFFSSVATSVPRRTRDPNGGAGGWSSARCARLGHP